MWIARIMAIATLGCALGAVLTSARIRIGRAAAVLLVGSAAELVGLYTGWPFGRYVYTTAWWPVLSLPRGHFFPVLLPFAWLMIVVAAWATIRSLGLSSAKVGAVGVGLLAAIVDIPLEYAVVRNLDYWRWLEKTSGLPAPLQNSIGWFLVATAGAFLIGNDAPRPVDRTGAWVLAIHVAFTLIVAW